MSDKSITIILFLIVIAVAGITGFAHNYKDGFDLSGKLKGARDRFFTIEGLNIKFSADMSIASDSLSIKYYVPCSTIEQRSRILENLPAIKHDIMMAMNSPEMMSSVQNRDFREIRSRSLAVVNKYSSSNVTRIYLDYFSLHALD